MTRIFRRAKHFKAIVVRKDYQDGYLRKVEFRERTVIRRMTGRFVIRATVGSYGNKKIRVFGVKPLGRQRQGLDMFEFKVFWKGQAATTNP
jgi:hypothetical protein